MTLEPHPAADLFPMMSDADLDVMAADIKANGQAVPIAVLNGAKIIDGRNRYEACRRAGVEPWTKEMQSEFSCDAEVVRFIISTNIHRRHLTDEQRDVIGAKLVTMQAGNPDLQSPQNAGIGVQDAAALVSSTPARIERARTIVRADPELADKVVRGEISKGKALKQIKAKSEPQTDPDLADDRVVDSVEQRAAEGDTDDLDQFLNAFNAMEKCRVTLMAMMPKITDKRLVQLVRDYLRHIEVGVGYHQVQARIQKLKAKP